LFRTNDDENGYTLEQQSGGFDFWCIRWLCSNRAIIIQFVFSGTAGLPQLISVREWAIFASKSWFLGPVIMLITYIDRWFPFSTLFFMVSVLTLKSSRRATVSRSHFELLGS
jgi:hypothetical protein